ncbi:hypothetical protein FKP32DRAFT_1760117 [Trametes sanguinea]|nr:hypothetical protein FKP32DRAFT_1760117 [Trametes sanguinea]
MSDADAELTRRDWSEPSVHFVVKSRAPRPPSIIYHVDQLPAELLVCIFCCLQWFCGWATGADQYRSAYYELSWLRLTWVCRQWRMIALSSPSLWTYIHCGKTPMDLAWVAAVIERSSGMPLDIKISPGGDAESILRIVFERNLAVRNLTVQIPSNKPHEKQLPALLTLFPASMPALQALKLVASSERVVDAWHTYIPDRAQFPSLRVLSLSGFHFPWESLLYESLHTLYLSSISYLPSASRFFQILKACPRLESLTYDQCASGRELFSDLDAVENMVTLPCLRHLGLASATRSVHYVYDRLCVPSSCSIITNYIDDSDEQRRPPVDAMLPRQRVFLDRLSTITSLSLTVLEDVRVYLAFGTNLKDMACQTEITGPWVHGPMVDHEIFDALVAVFANSPLTYFRLYDENGLRSLPASTWQSFFLRFPKLAYLDVGPAVRYTFDPDAVFDAILEALQAYKTDSGELYAQSLRMLILAEIVVDEYLANKLKFVSYLRDTRGSPLEQLIFNQLYCTKDTDFIRLVAELKKHVRTVKRY